MAAIVGYVLDESWTDPAIVEITVSEAEDLVYIRKVGGVGFDGVHSLRTSESITGVFTGV